MILELTIDECIQILDAVGREEAQEYYDRYSPDSAPLRSAEQKLADGYLDDLDAKKDGQWPHLPLSIDVMNKRLGIDWPLLSDGYQNADILIMQAAYWRVLCTIGSRSVIEATKDETLRRTDIWRKGEEGYYEN